jgi:hypothetical protein
VRSDPEGVQVGAKTVGNEGDCPPVRCPGRLEVGVLIIVELAQLIGLEVVDVEIREAIG